MFHQIHFSNSLEVSTLSAFAAGLGADWLPDVRRATAAGFDQVTAWLAAFLDGSSYVKFDPDANAILVRNIGGKTTAVTRPDGKWECGCCGAGNACEHVLAAQFHVEGLQEYGDFRAVGAWLGSDAIPLLEPVA